MGKSVLHIKSDIECRVYLFDEEKGVITSGKWFNLEVRKGVQDLLFVSTNDQSFRYAISYTVDELDNDYQININGDCFLKEREHYENGMDKETEERFSLEPPTEEELASGIEDRCGVIYSSDGKQLLKCKNYNLTEYVVAVGCKVIRGRAFDNSYTYNGFDCSNNLTRIILPDGLTAVGNSAFYDCQWLSHITLPLSLTEIGESAFYGNHRLVNIVLPDGLLKIGDGAFDECASLTSIFVSNGMRSHFEQLLPEWFHSRINEILPQRDGKELDEKLLQPPTDEELSKGIKDKDGVIYSRNGEQLLRCTRPLKKYVVVKGCRYIRGDAFGWFSNDSIINGSLGLSSVFLPDGLSIVGNGAFAGCWTLNSITIPKGMTRIGDNAFRGCGGLHSVILSEGLIKIGDDAFRGCDSLNNITFPNGLTNIGEGAFYCCKNLISITMKEGLTTIGRSAFSDCENLTSIIFPNGLNEIGDYAFSDCKSLTSVTLPDSLVNMGCNVFYECKKLTFITLPNNLTNIGDGVFTGTGIRSIVCKSSRFKFITGCLIDVVKKRVINYLSDENKVMLPKNLEVIGDFAFSDCSNITNVDIAEGVTKIGNLAFYACHNLTNIKLPESLKEIGHNAFSCCVSLTNITLPDGLTMIGEDAFDTCESLTSIYVSEGNRVKFEQLLPKYLHRRIKEIDKKEDKLDRSV